MPLCHDEHRDGKSELVVVQESLQSVSSKFCVSLSSASLTLRCCS
jgi:hypothetical protein